MIYLDYWQLNLQIFTDFYIKKKTQRMLTMNDMRKIIERLQ